MQSHQTEHRTVFLTRLCVASASGCISVARVALGAAVEQFALSGSMHDKAQQAQLWAEALC